MNDPLAVKSREDLVRYLFDLADEARRETEAVENPQTPDFIEASGAWLEGLDAFLRRHTGEAAPEAPTWSIIAMIFSAGLVYE
jgi:hypothetical protein